MASFFWGHEEDEDEDEGLRRRREEEERAVDVNNTDNSSRRWEQAIAHYRESCAHVASSRSAEKVRCMAMMDTSWSMEGKRLTCVKLGICSLLASFEGDDEMSLMTFSSSVVSVTNGFDQVGNLVREIPRLLEGMGSNGCTACYDGIVEGVGKIRDRAALHESFTEEEDKGKFKNVVIVLTDGEDNESSHSVRSVERLLVHPCVNNFMFILVAVGMSRSVERQFRSWMQLAHCKQVSVSVRTGSSLVGVFKEMLLCRILQSENTSSRFLQNGWASTVAGIAGGSGSNRIVVHGGEISEEAFLTLRAQLLRHLPNASRETFNDDDDHSTGSSSGVSIVSSEDDDDDDDTGSSISSQYSSEFRVDDAYDYLTEPILNNMASRSSSSTGSTSPSSTTDMTEQSDDDVDDNLDDDDKNYEMDDMESTTSGEAYPEECYCSISHTIMLDPVICADGHTYERKHIHRWLRTHDTSPNTNMKLPHKELVPNLSLRNLIQYITNKKSTVISNHPPLEQDSEA